jgi:hypothetical protein
MAVITRETLVLRGVSVLRDGLTVVARLGSGYQATQTPAPFSMRHPQPFNAGRPQAERWINPDEHQDASSQAGRSRTQAVGSHLPRSWEAVCPGRPAARLLPAAWRPWTRAIPGHPDVPSAPCPSWQVAKPGFTAGRSPRVRQWGPAGDRMS